MNLVIDKDSGVARLVLAAGRFDFKQYEPFKSAYEPALETPEVEEIRVDFGAVSYIDSSALGMLLLLKEKSEEHEKEVVLSNCNETVKQVIRTVNFHRLFAMED